MLLYSATLQVCGGANAAAVGNFSGKKQQEILVARQTHLSLLKPDPQTGKVNSILEVPVFGVIRSIAPFRLTGASKDYIILGTDSGKINILEYSTTTQQWVKVHSETFGKSQCRRIVPGEYLACDPKGRAVMIAAVEKQKLVYILNRDSAARLTISSPLEAHRNQTLCFCLVGLDVGFENPIFACIEVEYNDDKERHEDNEKMVTFYELDLGLNHVTRKWSEPVERSTTLLLPVPGGSDGPSGVLVCSDNYITWRNQGHPPHRIPIPRRINYLDNLNRGIQINTGVMHKMKDAFFILVQTEEGDIFKITIKHDGDTVQSVRIKYFDTVPPAVQLCILKSGFLYVVAEFGNSMLFQIESLGDDDEEQQEFTSIDHVPTEIEEDKFVYFRPRPLRNLSLVDESESLAPLMDLAAIKGSEEEPVQFYAACGQGARSSFRVLSHGVQALEMAVSELPGKPNAVWTTKLRQEDTYDAYIVVSFLNATLVLSIGETVEEVTNTGFLTGTTTLCVQQIGPDSLLQVHPQGVRHIQSDRRVNEWRPPGGLVITKAVAVQRQVLIALNSQELLYFELDQSGTMLNEHSERRQMSAAVTSISIAPVPRDRMVSKFGAVACSDQTVRIISLSGTNCLEPVSVQSVDAVPDSVLLGELWESGSSKERPITNLYLNVGLVTGVIVRSVVDDITGALSDRRSRFLGSRTVKLYSVTVQEKPAVLALSSRPWLIYTTQMRTVVTPIAYSMLDTAHPFSSDACPEGLVATSQNTLRIIAVENLNEVLKQRAYPLEYTPRQIVHVPKTGCFVVLETENGVYTPSERDRLLEQRGEELENKNFKEEALAQAKELSPQQFGHWKAMEKGKWVSQIRYLDPSTEEGEVLSLLPMVENEAAHRACLVQFANSEDPVLVVGSTVGLCHQPRKWTCGYISAYRFTHQCRRLELLHKTKVEEPVFALAPFKGKLLAGIGRTLRLYDMGKRQLLKKTENRSFPSMIVSIHVQGDRIVVGDAQESFIFATFRPSENGIIAFADDTVPRHLCSACQLDYRTMAGGDKFGNFFTVRLDSTISDEIDEDVTGQRIVYEKGYLNGAPYKVENLNEFHLGDIITSMARSQLVTGGREVVVYGTLMGSLSVMIPFVSKDDAEFFMLLEMAVRQELDSLTGRDHLQFRSYFVPVKRVVDGTLCEMFMMLSPEKRRKVAGELDRTTGEVMKKLEDIRARAAF